MRNNQLDDIKKVSLNNREAVENLVELIANLGSVMAKETILLRQMKVNEVGPLQAEKLRLTTLLEGAKQEIANNANLRSGFTGAERKELETVGQIFSEIAMENYAELKKAMAVNKKLISCISAAASEYLTKDRGYTRTGLKDVNAMVNSNLPPLTYQETA